jgi:hypothetical protein
VIAFDLYRTADLPRLMPLPLHICQFHVMAGLIQHIHHFHESFITICPTPDE